MSGYIVLSRSGFLVGMYIRTGTKTGLTKEEERERVTQRMNFGQIFLLPLSLIKNNPPVLLSLSSLIPSTPQGNGFLFESRVCWEVMCDFLLWCMIYNHWTQWLKIAQYNKIYKTVVLYKLEKYNSYIYCFINRPIHWIQQILKRGINYKTRRYLLHW